MFHFNKLYIMLHSYLNLYKRTSWLWALIVILFGTNVKAQALLNEGFEGATFPPTGWTRTTTGNAGVQFNRTTSSALTAGTNNCTGTPSAGAAFSDYTPTAGTGYLITPQLNIPASPNVTTLTFCERGRYNDGPWPSTYSVRVSTTGNAPANFTNILFTRNDDATINYNNRSLNLSSFAGQSIYIAFVHENNDGSGWVIDNVNVTAVLPCSGTPAPTATSISPSSGCPGTPISISTSVSPAAGGLTYQWQYASNVAGPYTNIPGATSATFNSSMPGSQTFYRCLVTCTNSGLSQTSTPASVTPSSAATYATLPYTQNFENTWATSGCVTGAAGQDRPDASWVNTPAQGNQSWRADNTTAALSGWTTVPASSAYTPTGANGTTRSARFCSYWAPNGSNGTLDLYINLSGSTPLKDLSFYYRNQTGSDNVTVLFSDNGGVSFTPLATTPASLTTNTAWQLVTATINSSSPTGVIRFRATSDFGFSDIGLDEVNVAPASPRISVTGLGFNIPQDKYTTLEADGTFFGTTNGSGTFTSTFTINNVGSDVMNISSIAMQRGSNSGFSISGAPTTIPVSSSANFTVTFDGSKPTQLDTVVITSNSINFPVFRFGVAAINTTGVTSLDENLAEGQLALYPNPTTSKVNIEIKGAKYTSVKATLYDLTGRVVQQSNIESFSGKMDLDLRNQEKGSYILILETGGERIARRIVKQ